MRSISSRPSAFFMVLMLTTATSLFLPSLAGDTISPSEPLREGQALVSSGGIFQLGFFTPGTGNSSKHLGIWYAKITNPKTIVWVANREKPIQGGAGAVLRIDGSGNLEIAADKVGGTVFWSSASGGEKESGVLARLLDTGNLEVIASNGRVVWQSFDYPTDTLLPGMKLGLDLPTRLNRELISWRSFDDPSPGEFSYSVSTHGVPQSFVRRRRDSAPLIRSGPWFGLPFSAGGEPVSNSLVFFQFDANADEVYYTYHVRDPNSLMRLVISPSQGKLERFVWQNRTQEWDSYWSVPKDTCDNYNQCGSFGMCNAESPFCKCLPGFVSEVPGGYSLRDGSSFCFRRTELGCAGDGFRKVPSLKLPDAFNATMDLGMSTEQCARACLAKCSCVAYAAANYTTRSGCIMWTGELLDIKEFPRGGEELYLRVAASELDTVSPNAPAGEKKKHPVAVIVSASVTAVTAIVLGGVAIRMTLRRKHKRKNGSVVPTTKVLDECEDNREQDVQLPFLEFERIVAATDNFSEQNTLGQGGFGPVYRGRLECGQHIAVKRLSQVSRQGVDQFKTEVKLIARLQHRNLVRLLGCCIEQDERMLVYEYMPNGSLNAFIFDNKKSHLLDWRQRLDIISGIARGVLYLHQDSRLRIIHRDLKAGNVLLDVDMNPKISDFGTARILEGNRIKDNTATVVGTYGYMAPEYVLDGVFSMKSDVFSFGVLVLEILSGKKGRKFSHQCDETLTLIGYAWKLWSEGNSRELLDAALGLAEPPEDLLRCIQIGLLCVQERVEDRPEMSDVVFMLGSQCLASLPRPKKPGFASTSATVAVSGSSSSEIGWTRANAAGGGDSCTVGEVTLTVLEGR